MFGGVHTYVHVCMHVSECACTVSAYLFVHMYSETCLVRTSKGTQISTYYQRYLLSGLVYVHEVYTGTQWGVVAIQEYVLNQVLTLSGLFMYMRYTHGQNEEYLLSRSMY